MLGSQPFKRAASSCKCLKLLKRGMRAQETFWCEVKKVEETTSKLRGLIMTPSLQKRLYLVFCVDVFTQSLIICHCLTQHERRERQQERRQQISKVLKLKEIMKDRKTRERERGWDGKRKWAMSETGVTVQGRWKQDIAEGIRRQMKL